MIDLTCQSCGERVGVQSLLTAAQQPCIHCGKLLMGARGRGPRTARPAGFGEPAPAAASPEPGRGSAVGLWLGVFAGALAGVGGVVAVASSGAVIPPSVRGILLGALTGVLLSPVFAVVSFFSMLILPFSLEGILGDSLWNRMVKALQERRLGPLFFPVVIYVGLPMALLAWGGSKMKNPDVLVITAGLGAVVLGAILGAMFGSLAGKGRQD